MRLIDAEFERFNRDFPDAGKSTERHGLRLVPKAPIESLVASPTGPSVAILLCIYNGKHFLEEQLESIARQTHKNWRLYISDDGDCEDSRGIVACFSERFEQGRVSIVDGPRKGFVENFLSLTCDQSIDADYFAYSDQDDIWHADKLEKAIRLLAETSGSEPGLYCSRTVIVDQEDKEVGLSPLFSKPPSFANALVQNIGGGNTMIFNRKAREIALEVGQNIPVITHDWWMYLLITGVEGRVIYDANPSIRYRQHSSNLVGFNITWAARFYRIYLLLKGRFKDYNDRNLGSLGFAYHRLSEENKKLFDEFTALRKSRLLNRIRIYKQSKIYRQTLFGNIGLWVAVVLNKL